ncbi:MAG: hypothetical protein QOJ73_7364 [Streptosporangiaceae bacterium]|jgi:hypothetical protein|nr:hypothetical protein [Streptosporangiaceae bacterium]
MTGVMRVLAWGSAIAGGVSLLGLGSAFVVADLETADKLGSVVGALCALVGLGLSVYGVILGRRTPAARSGRQRVDRIDAGRGVDVVDGVAGDVFPRDARTPPAPRREAAGPVVHGEQSVTNVRAKDGVRVVRGVGGDVNLPP